MTFGMMCCRMTRRREAPRACTASTYTFSFTDRAADRTTRATRGMTGIEMAITTFYTARPSELQPVVAVVRVVGRQQFREEGQDQHPQNDQRAHGADRLRPDELRHLFRAGEARRQFCRCPGVGQPDVRRHG